MSTTAPPHLWNRQQNEPAADYQLFLAWLRLPPPRRLRPAAAALNCSYSRLRTLSARRTWKTRADAYDDCRANAASKLLDRALSEETADLKRRIELFREQEWALHEEMLAAAREATAKIRTSKRCPTLVDIARILQLAFTLGRQACEMPATTPPGSTEPPPLAPDWEEALKRVYGKPAHVEASEK